MTDDFPTPATCVVYDVTETVAEACDKTMSFTVLYIGSYNHQSIKRSITQACDDDFDIDCLSNLDLCRQCSQKKAFVRPGRHEV